MGGKSWWKMCVVGVVKERDCEKEKVCGSVQVSDMRVSSYLVVELVAGMALLVAAEE